MLGNNSGTSSLGRDLECWANGGNAGSSLFKSNRAKVSPNHGNSLIGRLGGRSQRRNQRRKRDGNRTLTTLNVITAFYRRLEVVPGGYGGPYLEGGRALAPGRQLRVP